MEAGKDGIKFEAGGFSSYGMTALTASPGKQQSFLSAGLQRRISSKHVK